mmetsp:Transcript_69053/g.133282  ORF Transcript_69053/g.133282 Transcript_69053/m.133282 type:complete len:84 (-) Transcript_69053:283-534(-)
MAVAVPHVQPHPVQPWFILQTQLPNWSSGSAPAVAQSTVPTKTHGVVVVVVVVGQVANAAAGGTASGKSLRRQINGWLVPGSP